MSHGDKISALPANFHTIATTKDALFVGIAHESKPIHGIQSHPEVTYKTTRELCRWHVQWAMAKFADKELERISALVGEKGQVLGAVSSGVDSIVTAKLT